MNLGPIHKSRVKSHSTKGAKGKGMLPANHSGKPGFKSKTKGIKDPTC